jgi:hypothetical protein
METDTQGWSQPVTRPNFLCRIGFHNWKCMSLNKTLRWAEWRCKRCGDKEEGYCGPENLQI